MMNTDFIYMKAVIAADLAEFLAKDFDKTITEALDAMYSSETY